jgi:YihY family inner membrane protein
MQLVKPPVNFAWQTWKSFNDNRGTLLAAGISYYALLSGLPLMILLVIALSHFVDQAELLNTMGHYLEWLVPSESKAVLAEVSNFLDNRIAIGAVLLVVLIRTSKHAFSGLEEALTKILHNPKKAKSRHPLVSAILPYCFVLLLCFAILGLTIISVTLQTIAQENIHLIGNDWSLRGASGVLLYLLGLTMETLLLATLYHFLGRARLKHALIGGLTATLIWEVIRHILVWYFSTLSKTSVIFGSLGSVVVVLFSLNLATTLLLFGGQVISEYDRLADNNVIQDYEHIDSDYP